MMAVIVIVNTDEIRLFNSNKNQLNIRRRDTLTEFREIVIDSVTMYVHLVNVHHYLYRNKKKANRATSSILFSPSQLVSVNNVIITYITDLSLSLFVHRIAIVHRGQKNE